MLLIAFSLCDLSITLMFNYCVFVRFFRQTTPLLSIKWSKTTRKYTKGGTAEEKTFSKRSHEPPSAPLI